jgi:hypothetical protein
MRYARTPGSSGPDFQFPTKVDASEIVEVNGHLVRFADGDSFELPRDNSLDMGPGDFRFYWEDEPFRGMICFRRRDAFLANYNLTEPA